MYKRQQQGIFLRDSFHFPTQLPGYSYGRFSDGMDSLFSLNPTPRKPNEKKALPISINTAMLNESVYPNPTSGLVCIQSAYPGIKQLTILNAAGQILIQNQNFENNIWIDATNYTSGMYIVVIQSGRNIEYFKFIKQ